MVAAALARVSAFSFNAMPFSAFFTLWALVRLAETHIEQMLNTCVIVRELIEELTDIEQIKAFYAQVIWRAEVSVRLKAKAQTCLWR